MSAPLAGRTIVVTRASDQAGAFTAMLESQGARVVEVPLVRIVEPDDGGAALRLALGDLDRFDWLVVTSPNGARRVAEALAPRLPGRPFVAAVGTATAQVLGRRVDLVPERQIGEALVDAFPRSAGGGSVLLVQGAQARRVVGDGLRHRGWQVEQVIAYDTVPEAVPHRLVAAIAGSDAITFLSGSAATALARGVEPGKLSLPPHVISIGPATTAAATAVGLSITATAQSHTLSGMVEALVRELSTTDHNG